jgi:hypothetical protein
MQRVQDRVQDGVQDDIETIHLYVVREEPKKPYTALPLFAAFLCLVGMAALTIYSSYHPLYEHETISIPAHFLPLENFTATQQIIPTGIKTYPATTAHGILTLTNGSVITQELPQGMIFSGSGVEVITDEAVVVPAGIATGFGVATVAAHSLVSGAKGNLATLSINAVYGTSLFIRNLSPFTGGADSYSVQVVTEKDKQTALNAARSILTTQVKRRQAILANPCKESLQEIHAVELTWTCQFGAYPHVNIPTARITGFTLHRKILLVDIMFVARPHVWRYR